MGHAHGEALEIAVHLDVILAIAMRQLALQRKHKYVGLSL